MMLEKHFKSLYRRLFHSISNPAPTDKPSLPTQHLETRLLSALQACSDPSHLTQARLVHAQALTSGSADVGLLGNRILGAYVLCGSLHDARNLFFRLKRDVALPWNWMIRGFNEMGAFEFSVLMYFKMWASGVLPDKYTYTYVIKACCGLSAVGLGRLVHHSAFSMGFETDVFVGSGLINMYAGSGLVEDAREVFEKMPHKDSVLWNVMINCYAKSKYVKEAFDVFRSMRWSGTKPNYVSLACVLSICSLAVMLCSGVQIHGLAIRSGLEFEQPVANTLLAMYSKCRCWCDMRKLFDTMPQVELVTWNSVISGYVQNGLMKDALNTFHEMRTCGIKPDSITFTSLLPAFSDSAGLREGKEIQAYVVRNGLYLDAFLKSALIDVYFKCREVEMARKIFAETETMDVVICSAMISGYILNGYDFEALEMFRRFFCSQLKLNAVIIASVLPACSSMATLRLGKEFHCFALKNEFIGRCYVGSALTDMYAKCGRLDLGYHIFIRMSERDVVAWNSMISSFAQNAEPEEALNLFREMRLQRVEYDNVSISSALSACANLPALRYGKEIHNFMIRGTLQSDVFAESALIDMYGKCGKLAIAQTVFDLMERKNEVSWNSIIAAYGIHGHVEDAKNLLHQMKKEGFLPDNVTFLSMLSACGHAGQVDDGLRYFSSMSEDYGLEPRMEHFACMVDLFGRAGMLNEALDFIRKMPVEPDSAIWGAFLGACRVHRNVELAELASRELFRLDPKNSGYYVLMSNINAVSGRWEGVREVRNLMKERNVQKSPGCSWIDINSTTHMFVAADKSHPAYTDVVFFLNILRPELREESYIPNPDIIYPVFNGLL